MRTLVVEDEKHLNRMISEAILDEGYSVDSCFNGLEALELCECAEYRRAGLRVENHAARVCGKLPLSELTSGKSVYKLALVALRIFGFHDRDGYHAASAEHLL